LPQLRPTHQVTELLGDGIGSELSHAVHRLAEALPIRLNFVEVDFRLENRRMRGPRVYDEAVELITSTRVALKHPTTTAEESPNAILRRRLELSVIHRPVYTIPGVPTNFRRELDLDIVRIATGGTYDDPGRMIGEDGAVSLRIVERRPVREAARYAFNLARKTSKRVTSASKYTIQKATDGLFEQVAVEVAGQFPEVPHFVELFDALLGKIIMAPDKFQIVLVLNEYGDFLSDMACGLAGSLGIGASANLAFDAAAVVRVALFDAAHGTAPDIAGKNLANPTAIFLALSMLLYQLGEITIGHAVKTATLDLLRGGVRTRDLGGQESTDSFTEAVAAEVVKRLTPPSSAHPQPSAP
jgi:isocitrate dehydrogenase (NAD+)